MCPQHGFTQGERQRREASGGKNVLEEKQIFYAEKVKLSSLEIMRFYQSFVKRESWELRGSPTWTTTACWMRQKAEAKVIP